MLHMFHSRTFKSIIERHGLTSVPNISVDYENTPYPINSSRYYIKNAVGFLYQYPVAFVPENRAKINTFARLEILACPHRNTSRKPCKTEEHWHHTRKVYKPFLVLAALMSAIKPHMFVYVYVH